MFNKRSERSILEALLCQGIPSERHACSFVVDALSRMASRGDRDVASALTELIARCPQIDLDARRSAVDALAKIARQGEPDVILAILDCLEDPEWSLRRSAVDALPFVAHKGNPAVVIALLKHLSDGERRVREASWQSLLAMAAEDACEIHRVIARFIARLQRQKQLATGQSVHWSLESACGYESDDDREPEPALELAIRWSAFNDGSLEISVERCLEECVDGKIVAVLIVDENGLVCVREWQTDSANLQHEGAMARRRIEEQAKQDKENDSDEWCW